MREYHRLLYVALTRARDRILVCGWQTARDNQGSWYKLIERGMARLDCTAQPFGAWEGDMLAADAPGLPGARPLSASPRKRPVPHWAGSAPLWQPAPLPPEPPLPRPLAPSRPEGIHLGPVPPQRSPLAQAGRRDRFARGLLVHALLQHLPDFPVELRTEAALRHAASSSVDKAEALARQALAVLEAPDLTPLFGPGSRAEQPIAGVAGGQIVTGQVDRLAVLSDAVLIADYKTSRAPPATPEASPVLYLRQMAAYRAVLRLLYPDRPVRCTLIWTEGPTIMHLPDLLLDRHAPGVPLPA
jgi:ATP-dependent helicase/nuclease subunit A